MDFQIDYSAKAIGARIKAARVRARLTQEELELRASLGPRALASYEQGVRTPSDDVLSALGSVLEVHPAALRYGESVLAEAAFSQVSTEISMVADMLKSLANRLGKDSQAPDRMARAHVIREWGDLAAEGDLRRRRLIAEFEAAVEDPVNAARMHPEDAERMTPQVVRNLQRMLDIYESASTETRKELRQSFYWSFQDAFTTWLKSPDGSGFPVLSMDVLRGQGSSDTPRRRDATDALADVSRRVAEKEAQDRT